MPGEIEELRAFVQADEVARAGNGRFDPEKASDDDFAKFIDGEAPGDVEALAKQRLAEKKSTELEELKQSIRDDMTARGWDHETHSWKRPDVSAEEVTSPMPDAYQDADGVVLVSPERFEQFVANESEVGSLSEAQFEALLEARSQGREFVFRGPEPDSEDVNALYHKLGSERAE